MDNNNEYLEGIVSKIKKQGISAGEEAKKHIIEEAKVEAAEIVEKANAVKKQIIEDAQAKAAQIEKNTRAAIAQASRDMVEATKIATLQYLKTVFGKQCDGLFTQKEYLEQLLKIVIDNIQGNKTIEIPAKLLNDMESFLLKEALSEQIELKPLPNKEAKIVVNTTEKNGVQFVLSSHDVEDSLFALLNKDLVAQIIKVQEN